MEGFLYDHEAPFQLVHVHKLVSLGTVSPEQLSYQLRKSFPGPRRVKVAPLHTDRSLDENLCRLVGYMTKHMPYFEVKSTEGRKKFSTPFDDHLLTYYARMHHHLGGLGGTLAFNSRG